MKPRFEAMSKRIPNDIGQIVTKVYDKLKLDNNGNVKRLPLDASNDYLSPIKQAGIAYHSLDENIAEKRVQNSLLDKYNHYKHNTQLNREAQIYMSICATADQYGPDDDDNTDVVTGNLFPPQ